MNPNNQNMCDEEEICEDNFLRPSQDELNGVFNFKSPPRFNKKSFVSPKPSSSELRMMGYETSRFIRNEKYCKYNSVVQDENRPLSCPVMVTATQAAVRRLRRTKSQNQHLFNRQMPPRPRDMPPPNRPPNANINNGGNKGGNSRNFFQNGIRFGNNRNNPNNRNNKENRCSKPAFRRSQSFCCNLMSRFEEKKNNDQTRTYWN